MKTLGLNITIGAVFKGADAFGSVLKNTDTLKNKLNSLKSQRVDIAKKFSFANSEAKKLSSTITKLQRNIKLIDKSFALDRKLQNYRNNFKSSFMDKMVLGATIVAPFKAGVDFESSMARVKALSGATKEEFAKLQQSAKKLGSTTVFSASEAAQGMQFLAMAGFKTNEITKAMPGLLDLAAAGQVDLATTSDITSNILSGFGISADKTAHVADVMAKAMTTANVDVRMLGETMKYVAPAASGLGSSLEEVTTLAAKLGDVGIQGSNAGTALRSMYLRMASPPKEAQKMIEQLGLQTKDANGNFVGMIEVIRQLQEKTKGLSNTQIADIMKKMFGVEATSAASALLKLPIEKLKEYERTLENADGTAKKIAKTQTDTVGGSFKALGSALEGLSISFSTLFLPVIKKTTEAITKITQSLNGFISEHKTLATVIGGVVAGFVGFSLVLSGVGYMGSFVIGGINKMVRSYLTLSSVLATTSVKTTLLHVATKAYTVTSSMLGGALNLLGGALRFVGSSMLWIGKALLANPIGIVVTLIAGGAYLIYSNWDKLSGFFSSLWENIKSTFEGAWEFVKSSLQYSPIGIVVSNWGNISNWFKEFWSTLKNHFNTGAQFLSAIFTSPINTIQKYWHKLLGWIGKKIEWVSSIGSKIKNFFGFGDEEKKISIKPVAEKLKPIVAATVVSSTIATANQAPTKPIISPQEHKSVQINTVAAKPKEERKIIAKPVTIKQYPTSEAKPITAQKIDMQPIKPKSISSFISNNIQSVHKNHTSYNQNQTLNHQNQTTNTSRNYTININVSGSNPAEIVDKIRVILPSLIEEIESEKQQRSLNDVV